MKEPVPLDPSSDLRDHLDLLICAKNTTASAPSTIAQEGEWYVESPDNSIDVAIMRTQSPGSCQEAWNRIYAASEANTQEPEPN